LITDERRSIFHLLLGPNHSEKIQGIANSLLEFGTSANQPNGELLMAKALTQLIQRWQNGETGAEKHICAEILPYIHAQAALQLRNNKQRTLRATELANDVFIELRDSFDAFSNTREIKSLAARMVRMAIIDHIRNRMAEKRGSQFQFVELSSAVDVAQTESIVDNDWLLLDTALNELAIAEPRSAKLVELRYFVGMTLEESAAELSISSATATRIWRFARAHLADKLGGSGLAP
jgi:RNA polymerase sigma factor (TIGR02999 family)